ncbi:hypothetical protein OSB04_025401 [Centaurea solstitialis]|uniref:Endonuclease/exonuclease/phosphatase domain-containing protein n=1 Tax=Centaurea solstitialis TaxID=347529 RepID=A0AA38SPM7_9ASTR|nr:hypothetical protein OSB04_025401 [Centaurea solstitialis]
MRARSKNFVVHNNITPGEPPLPSGSPSGSLRNWVLGLALTFILPFITRKWGPFIIFKNKVEHAMEAIEVVAKGADEILDEITEDLPENSKLRKTMEAMDEMVEGVAQTTHIANDIIDKVEELEEKLEKLNLEKEEAAATKSVIQAEEEKAWVSNQAQSDVGTRIIVAWDCSAVDLMVLESHAQFMHCEALWSGLRKFKVLLGNKPWIVAGDFNCLLFPHDALGGQSRRNDDMMDFAACLEDVDLFDVRYVGIHHTWCQKPREEAGLRRKLDRILINTDFTSVFQDASARFLPRGLFGPFAWIGGMVMWKFLALKHELDTVQLAMDLDPYNDALREDLEHYRLAYQQACWNNMSAARQRAKVKWLADGDANTKYFHQVVREKRHSHHIHSVSNSDGIFVYGKDVAIAFIDHFKQIIGTRDDSLDPNMPADLFVSKVSFVDAIHMIRPIVDSEIKDAMFQIGNDKAPGSDGFTSNFFKATWEITDPDVLLAIHNFFLFKVLQLAKI